MTNEERTWAISYGKYERINTEYRKTHNIELTPIDKFIKLGLEALEKCEEYEKSREHYKE